MYSMGHAKALGVGTTPNSGDSSTRPTCPAADPTPHNRTPQNSLHAMIAPDGQVPKTAPSIA